MRSTAIRRADGVHLRVHATFSEWLESALDFGEAGRYVKLRTRPFSEGPVLVEGRRQEVADELVAALQSVRGWRERSIAACDCSASWVTPPPDSATRVGCSPRPRSRSSSS